MKNTKLMKYFNKVNKYIYKSIDGDILLIKSSAHINQLEKEFNMSIDDICASLNIKMKYSYQYGLCKKCAMYYPYYELRIIKGAFICKSCIGDNIESYLSQYINKPEIFPIKIDFTKLGYLQLDEIYTFKLKEENINNPVKILNALNKQYSSVLFCITDAPTIFELSYIAYIKQ